MPKGLTGGHGVVTVKCPPLVAHKLRQLMSATGRSSGGIIRDLIMAATPDYLGPPPTGSRATIREPIRPEHLEAPEEGVEIVD